MPHILNSVKTQKCHPTLLSCLFICRSTQPAPVYASSSHKKAPPFFVRNSSFKSGRIKAKYTVKVPSIEKETRIFYEITYSESRRNRRSHHAGGC